VQPVVTTPFQPLKALVGAVALAGVTLLMLPSCDRHQTGRANHADSSASPRAPVDSVQAPPRRASYTLLPVVSMENWLKLEKQLDSARVATLLKVNRLDRAHVRDRDTLVVPDSVTGFIALSPFPGELPAHRALHKLLLVSLRVQAFAAYDSGRLSRWGPTSTGRKSLPTPPALYHTNWKDRERISTFNDEWKLEWYVNLHNFLGISLHLYDLPGYPASHSCVRLALDDAQWLYAWSESWMLAPDPRHVLRHGTPVVVFGSYDYRARPPWKRLAMDSTATDVSPAEVEEALGKYLPPDTAMAARRDSSVSAVAPVARPAARPLARTDRPTVPPTRDRRTG
jgi:hypothetical protein